MIKTNCQQNGTIKYKKQLLVFIITYINKEKKLIGYRFRLSRI